MQIKATLSPIGSKKLDETIVNLVDTHFDGGIQKFGIKFAWGVAGIFGQDGKNTLLAWARGFFEDFVKNTLKENNIYATVEKLDISIDHEDLNISLVADNIDYTKSITKNTKRIIDGLKKISPDNVAWGIIDILGKAIAENVLNINGVSVKLSNVKRIEWHEDTATVVCDSREITTNGSAEYCALQRIFGRNQSGRIIPKENKGL